MSKFLNDTEFARLVELLGLLNDTSVTQLDQDESRDLHLLLYRVTNDGQIDYEFLGQTQEEIALLREHDEDEDLHAFVNVGSTSQEVCGECGDNSSGLMHNNTWRNVEPLLQND